MKIIVSATLVSFLFSIPAALAKTDTFTCRSKDLQGDLVIQDTGSQTPAKLTLLDLNGNPVENTRVSPVSKFHIPNSRFNTVFAEYIPFIFKTAKLERSSVESIDVYSFTIADFATVALLSFNDYSRHHVGLIHTVNNLPLACE